MKKFLPILAVLTGSLYASQHATAALVFQFSGDGGTTFGNAFSVDASSPFNLDVIVYLLEVDDGLSTETRLTDFGLTGVGAGLSYTATTSQPNVVVGLPAGSFFDGPGFTTEPFTDPSRGITQGYRTGGTIGPGDSAVKGSLIELATFIISAGDPGSSTTFTLVDPFTEFGDIILDDMDPTSLDDLFETAPTFTVTTSGGQPPVAVPEPSTVAALTLAMLSAGSRRLWRRRSSPSAT